MRYAYCTLFNSNYLDKGLVTIHSLLENSKSAVIYVLAMDEKCYKVLTDMGKNQVIPIRLSDFENERLLAAKAERSAAEYCWSCSGSLILYVLETYGESNCTYIDADLCFYRNPSFLIDEMIKEGKSVSIIEHGFKKDLMYEHSVNGSGRFCVEFNTFLNNEESLEILKHWIDDILRECSADVKGNLGDQSYLTEWPDKYDCIHIVKNIGAGMAPWNLNRFKLEKIEDHVPVISEIGKKGNLEKAVFYHFHNMKYIDRTQVNIGVYHRYWKVDEALVEAVYRPYLAALEEQKQMLESKYEISGLVKAHPAWSNENKSFSDKIQKLIKDLWKGSVGKSFKNLIVRVNLNLMYRFNHKKDILYI